MEDTNMFQEFSFSRTTGPLTKTIEEDEDEKNRLRRRRGTPKVGIFGVIRYPHTDSLYPQQDTSGSDNQFMSQEYDPFSNQEDNNFHQEGRNPRSELEMDLYVKNPPQFSAMQDECARSTETHNQAQAYIELERVKEQLLKSHREFEEYKRIHDSGPLIFAAKSLSSSSRDLAKPNSSRFTNPRFDEATPGPLSGINRQQSPRDVSENPAAIVYNMPIFGNFNVPNALIYANAIDNLYNNNRNVELEIWIGKNPQLKAEMFLNFWTSRIVQNEEEFDAILTHAPEFVKRTRAYCAKNSAKHTLDNRSAIEIVKENLQFNFALLDQEEKMATIKTWATFTQEQQELVYPTDPSAQNQKDLVNELVKMNSQGKNCSHLMRYVFNGIRDKKPPITTLVEAFNMLLTTWMDLIPLVARHRQADRHELL